VSLIQADGRLVDPRIRQLRDTQPMLADTLAAYLDCFGDIAAVADHLHVHPNTVRYRVRRLEKVIGASLNDAELRLLLSLSLRAGR
jgi:DNA-binding PucR family transcriptional regulator